MAGMALTCGAVGSENLNWVNALRTGFASRSKTLEYIGIFSSVKLLIAPHSVAVLLKLECRRIKNYLGVIQLL